MKNLLFAFLLLLSVSSYAKKYYPATVFYTTGGKATMLVVSPEYLQENQVLVKSTEQAKAEKLDGTTIAKIIYQVENSDPVTYLRERFIVMGKAKDSHMWVQELLCGHASLYVKGGGMVITRAGAPHNIEDVTFYAKRKGEEGITYLGEYIVSGAFNVGATALFIKHAKAYFGDCPQLVTKLENKHYKVQEALAVVEDYNKLKQSKK